MCLWGLRSRELGLPALNPDNHLSSGSKCQEIRSQRCVLGLMLVWGGCSQVSRVPLGGDGPWDVPPGLVSREMGPLVMIPDT